jgi:hypothetical protein
MERQASVRSISSQAADPKEEAASPQGAFSNLHKTLVLAEPV